MKKQPITYIDGNEKKGILYDARKIVKEFDRLGVPKDVYSPVGAFLESSKIKVGVSERSTGKTTNWVLLGMVMHEMYGTLIEYVRQSEDMIMPKIFNKFMNVIIEYGYIDKITDGKYNSCYLNAREWHYCRTENGTVVDKDPEPFMYCSDLDEAQKYKSSLNHPTGDLIIFDEFISKRYFPNEFVTFCDHVKTIIRERHSPIIVMLANTTNLYHTYFQELMIQDELLHIKVGEHFTKITGGNTSIFCERIGAKNKERQKQNELFFGFKNPLLSSVTGGDWAIANYPHIERDPEDGSDTTRILSRLHYIRYNNYLVNVEICQNRRLGTHIRAHKATKTYDDSIIYCIDGITKNNERHKFGYNAVDGLIFLLFKRNKWYYSTNEVGNVVDNYITQAKKML